jgi:hypothetical protein
MKKLVVAGCLCSSPPTPGHHDSKHKYSATERLSLIAVLISQ